MIRIKKPLARKMFYSGHTVTIVPCKCGVNNEVAKAELNLTCGIVDPLAIENRFDRLVNEFTYGNCNVETGYYVHYYVTEQAMDNYNMCLSMCSAGL